MLGELVKWKGEDGGWRTGRRVKSAVNGLAAGYALVQHSCNYQLEWVRASKLEQWQPRSEWEVASGKN